MRLVLAFNDVVVGEVHDAFKPDGTWFGRYEPRAVSAPTAVHLRVAEFVAFCTTWNERERHADGRADPAEFDSFRDVVCDGSWRAHPDDGGRSLVLQDAPVFFAGGDVSFSET